MLYELLNKNEKLYGEVDFPGRPQQDETIIVDDLYFRWANVLHAFIRIPRPNSTIQAKQLNKKEK